MSDLVIVTVKVPKTMVEQINTIAKVKKKTRSEIIRESIRMYIMSELYGVQAK